MIKAVIFDLDGTLLDTLDDIVDSVNLTLSQYHFDCVNKLMVKEAIGNGVNRLISDLTNVTGIKLDELVNKQNENYYKLFNHKTKPFVGINDLLIELQNQKIFYINLGRKPSSL